MSALSVNNDPEAENDCCKNCADCNSVSDRVIIGSDSCCRGNVLEFAERFCGNSNEIIGSVCEHKLCIAAGNQTAICKFKRLSLGVVLAYSPLYFVPTSTVRAAVQPNVPL